ncbi:hypothetical protein RAA17_04805 [Komagataeibacter rhaeticus]|nr:hypothetical protein [Komagataeibacter rhaeticus]
MAMLPAGVLPLSASLARQRGGVLAVPAKGSEKHAVIRTCSPQTHVFPTLSHPFGHGGKTRLLCHLNGILKSVQIEFVSLQNRYIIS